MGPCSAFKTIFVWVLECSLTLKLFWKQILWFWRYLSSKRVVSKSSVFLLAYVTREVFFFYLLNLFLLKSTSKYYFGEILLFDRCNLNYSHIVGFRVLIALLCEWDLMWFVIFVCLRNDLNLEFSEYLISLLIITVHLWSLIIG